METIASEVPETPPEKPLDGPQCPECEGEVAGQGTGKRVGSAISAG